MQESEEYTYKNEYTDKSEKKKKNKDGFGIFDVFEAVISAVVVIALIFTFVFRVVTVDGPSMKPTLQDKDKLVITAWGYKAQHGDIVALYSEKLEKPIIKRIIAVGGDTVDINFTTGVVTVNGEEEDYTDELTNQQCDIAFPIIVPEGTVFVLGDNRGVSEDSRSNLVGCVDTRYIVGKVVGRIFPLGRWSVNENDINE